MLNGKCLTDPGNRTGNGTRVNVANCQAGPAQHWAVASDGTLRVHNHCLEIAGQGGAAGQQVQLWQCNGSTREVWMQGTAGELVNPASGLCLTGSSTVPRMGSCRIRPSEAWTLPAQPVLASVPGKCMDDLHSVGTNGNPIDMYSCNGTPIQNWTFEPDGTIRVYGNKCVTVRTLGRVGTKVQLWTCSAANRRGQQWAVVRTGEMNVELVPGRGVPGHPEHDRGRRHAARDRPLQRHGSPGSLAHRVVGKQTARVVFRDHPGCFITYTAALRRRRSSPWRSPARAPAPGPRARH